MRILSITAQKPDSTGSGVFLTELVKGFDSLGCSQAVVFGTTASDRVILPEGVKLFPVVYGTPELPFPVCGMSDEMPYESTRYRDLSEHMTRQLMSAFRRKIRQAVEEFRPQIILCHHLYFLAALVRQMCPDIPVWGLCHGSDLRQLGTNAWQADWIKGEMRKLDGIFALHEAQKLQIASMFELSGDLITVIGTGYNSNVFFIDPALKTPRERRRFLFAGKISDKKGVACLLKSLAELKNPESVELELAGGCGSQSELEKFRALAEKAPCPVTFLGKLDQQELARRMNLCDTFILPSFYEGLPLVLIEAMACGARTICTDLPGIRPWLDRAIPDNGTVFVMPPRMRCADEPLEEELPGFEHRLSLAMEESASRNLPDPEKVRAISWTGLCRKLLSRWN